MTDGSMYDDQSIQTEADRTPIDGRSTFDYLLEAAQTSLRAADKSERAAEQYRAMLDEQIKRNADQSIDLAEAKQQYLNAKGTLEHAVTAFLEKADEIRRNCKHCQSERPEPQLKAL